MEPRSCKDFGDLIRLTDQIIDYDTSGEKCFYILKERSEGKNERIRLLDLSPQLPLGEIRRNQLTNLSKEPLFAEAEGDFFPDLIEENGVYLVSMRFFTHYQSALELASIAFHPIGVIADNGRRTEEYVLVVPDQVDCVLEGTTRSTPGGTVTFFEIDEAKAGNYPIFRIKGFPHLIVTEKLDRIQFVGYECIRIENFLDYEGKRNQDYQERLTGERLKAIIELFRTKADATGDFDLRYRLLHWVDRYRIQEGIRPGLKAILESFDGSPIEDAILSDRFLLFFWSGETQTIELAAHHEASFSQIRFTIPFLAETVKFMAGLPPTLAELAKIACWEAIVYAMILECKILAENGAVHGEKRFRAYLHPGNRSMNPALVHDYKNPLQERLEKVSDFGEVDLSRQDLREFNFSNKNLAGKKIADSDLRRVNFHGSSLSRVEFTNCDLTGVDFSQSHLEGCCFNSCYLDRVNFKEAVLPAARFNRCTLLHPGFVKADLTGAQFEHNILVHGYFYQSKLSNAIFRLSETLEESIFCASDLKNVTFTTDEEDTVIQTCDFRSADLSGARFEVDRIINSDFTKAKLIQTDFSSCEVISQCNFQFTSCAQLDLAGVMVEGCDFTDTDLTLLKEKSGIVWDGNDFTHANLAGFEFGEGAYGTANHLEYTDLSYSNMVGVDFSNSLVIMPIFEGAKLNDACFKEEQLDFIELDSKQKAEIKVMPKEIAADTADEEANTN